MNDEQVGRTLSERPFHDCFGGGLCLFNLSCLPVRCAGRGVIHARTSSGVGTVVKFSQLRRSWATLRCFRWFDLVSLAVLQDSRIVSSGFMNFPYAEYCRQPWGHLQIAGLLAQRPLLQLADALAISWDQVPEMESSVVFDVQVNYVLQEIEVPEMRCRSIQRLEPPPSLSIAPALARASTSQATSAIVASTSFPLQWSFTNPFCLIFLVLSSTAATTTATRPRIRERQVHH